jgi:hypothetical protein
MIKIRTIKGKLQEEKETLLIKRLFVILQLKELIFQEGKFTDHPGLLLQTETRKARSKSPNQWLIKILITVTEVITSKNIGSCISRMRV